jgi:hypothetical protein
MVGWEHPKPPSPSGFLAMSSDNRLTPLSVNRRASRRAPFRGTIRVECRKGSLGLGPDLTAAALDISETGTRLILRSSLPKGQDVEILVHGAGGYGRPRKRTGRVIWSFPTEDDQCCVGVRFDGHIPFADLQALTRPPRVME